MAGGKIRHGAWAPDRTAGVGWAGWLARQDAADRRRAQPAAGENPLVARVELRRDQAISAGRARSRLHGRPLSRRRHACAPAVGASLRSETVALSASADHADAPGLGRRGSIDPRNSSRDLAK